ncbi:MAG: hypothetical protein COA91_12840 [Robiginitomaculum sp.]|nr:MAG: hypothetical protein COA91_12840 [Robiginitomaculum sp.]
MTEIHITPNLIKRTRNKLGMSRLEFARALGFKGSKRTVDKEIIQLERGKAELWPAKREIFIKMLLELRGDQKT